MSTTTGKSKPANIKEDADNYGQPIRSISELNEIPTGCMVECIVSRHGEPVAFVVKQNAGGYRVFQSRLSRAEISGNRLMATADEVGSTITRV